MTRVERDNAALTIREYSFGQMNILRMLGDDEAANNLQEAINIAIAILREPAHEWVRTTDRLPTEEDAIEVHDEWGFTHKEVAVLSSGWPFEALVKDIPAMLPGIMDIETIENKTTTFPYWMPLPKLPEVEGMTQEQRDDARYEAIMIVNELHKTIDYSVYCRLIDLIDMLGLPDETCTAEYPKPAQHEQVSPTTQSCPEKRTQNATTDACDRLRWLLTPGRACGACRR